MNVSKKCVEEVCRKMLSINLFERCVEKYVPKEVCREVCVERGVSKEVCRKRCVERGVSKDTFSKNIFITISRFFLWK